MLSPSIINDFFFNFSNKIQLQAGKFGQYNRILKNPHEIFEVAQLIEDQISKYLLIHNKITYDLDVRNKLFKDICILSNEFSKNEKLFEIAKKLKYCSEHFFCINCAQNTITPFVADESMMEVYVNLPCRNQFQIDRSVEGLIGLFKSDFDFFGKTVAAWMDKNNLEISSIGISKQMFETVWPYLTYFESRPSSMTAEELNEVLRKCKNLEILNLKDEKIEELPEELSNLIELNLTSCAYLAKLPLKMPLLQILHLSDCHDIKKIPEVMPALNEFSSIDCKELKYNRCDLPKNCTFF